jgi:hypothetical protein
LPIRADLNFLYFRTGASEEYSGELLSRRGAPKIRRKKRLAGAPPGA